MWLKLAAIYTTEWMIQKKHDGHHIMATTLFILTTCKLAAVFVDIYVVIAVILAHIGLIHCHHMILTKTC